MHRIRLETRAGTAVVSADGELDAFVASELEDVFEAASDSSRLVADLTDVSFLDSTVLGLVVRALRKVGERGGEARVVLPRGSARRIFEITTLDQVLPLAPSCEAALAELSEAG